MNGDLARIKKRSADFIDRSAGDLASFLSSYIQHKSVNPERALSTDQGGTEECQLWLADMLEGLGCFERVEAWEAAPGEYNVGACLGGHGSGAGRSVLFNGHSDVVPVTAHEYRNWIDKDPWGGQVQQGKVFGRGACDMKGANAAMIWAARAVADAGLEAPGQAKFTFTVGEESGNAEIGPLNVLERGYGADIAIVGEPTELAVCPAAVGWFFFRVDVEGEAGHAASRRSTIYPTRHGRPTGKNAIEVLNRVVDALSFLENQWGLYESHALAEPGTMAMNIVEVCGGGPQATIPSEAHAAWTVIVQPGRTTSDVVEEIREVIDAVRVSDRWLSEKPPRLTVPYLQGFYEPVNVPVDHPACQVLWSAARNAGSRSGISCMPTPSDANFFFDAGQPTIVYGPGNLLGNGVHGLNEYIEVDSLIVAAKSYAEFIVDWCSSEA